MIVFNANRALFQLDINHEENYLLFDEIMMMFVLNWNYMLSN